MLVRLKPSCMRLQRGVKFHFATTSKQEEIMNKPKADTLALMFARDILTTTTQTQGNQMNIVTAHSAKELGEFIRALSTELESLDENTNTIGILNMYKPELK